MIGGSLCFQGCQDYRGEYVPVAKVATDPVVNTANLHKCHLYIA